MGAPAPPPSSLALPEQAAKPVPDFYCTYLLRSTVRHASLYIGSTPNPARRLAQHNGGLQGGAKRTTSDKLRPWEMVFVVSGFMSRVAALQFEWAWQHTDHCRHANNKEPAEAHPETAVDPTSGQPKKKSSSRRSLSLKAAMSRLHLLLRSEYFRNWPLELRFFQPDVHRKWKEESSRADGLLSDMIKVVVDVNPVLPPNTGGRHPDIDEKSTFEGLDLSNKNLESYREKAAFLLDGDEHFDCGVCKRSVRLEDELILVCPQQSCRCVCHIMCLASTFLEDERVRDTIIPSEGACLTCGSTVQWPTVIRELSLRTRGQEAKKGSKPGAVPETQGFALAEYEPNADSGRVTSSQMDGRIHVTDAPIWHGTERKDRGYSTLQETYESKGLSDFCLPSVPEQHDASLEDKENANVGYFKHIPRRKAKHSNWDDVMIVE